VAELRDRHPHELSGGQQQRVALARALAVHPRMLLLDEPFTALDPALRASVRAEVGDIIRQPGTTAILVTHDQDEALSMADDVAVLRDGVVIQHASPHELYTQPVDVQLAQFLGAANLLPATVDGGCAVTAVGRLAVRGPVRHAGSNGHPAPQDGAALTALLRPEQLRIRLVASAAADPPRGGGAFAAAAEKVELTGRVVHSEYYGHDAVVRIDPEGPDAELLTVRLQGDAPPPLGTLVAVTAEGPVTVWPTDQGTATAHLPAPSAPTSTRGR
jgi:iron(III) transport system ATP-binding protein